MYRIEFNYSFQLLRSDIKASKIHHNEIEWIPDIYKIYYKIIHLLQILGQSKANGGNKGQNKY